MLKIKLYIIWYMPVPQKRLSILTYIKWKKKIISYSHVRVIRFLESIAENSRNKTGPGDVVWRRQPHRIGPQNIYIYIAAEAGNQTEESVLNQNVVMVTSTTAI